MVMWGIIWRSIVFIVIFLIILAVLQGATYDLDTPAQTIVYLTVCILYLYIVLMYMTNTFGPLKIIQIVY